MSELYHYGVRGMKWGVRRLNKRIAKYNSLAAKNRDMGNKAFDDVVNRLNSPKGYMRPFEGHWEDKQLRKSNFYFKKAKRNRAKAEKLVNELLRKYGEISVTKLTEI